MIKKEAPVMEQNLIWAGFVKVTADSSEKLEKLLTLPPYKLVKRKVNGQVAYIYTDPTNCQCAYIGNTEQYAAFRQLMGSMNENEATALNARMEAQEQEEAIMDSWDPL
jgi:phage gpG-like protein